MKSDFSYCHREYALERSYSLCQFERSVVISYGKTNSTEYRFEVLSVHYDCNVALTEVDTKESICTTLVQLFELAFKTHLWVGNGVWIWIVLTAVA